MEYLTNLSLTVSKEKRSYFCPTLTFYAYERKYFGTPQGREANHKAWLVTIQDQDQDQNFHLNLM